MKTLGRRMTKRARKFRVTHPKHNQQRHEPRGFQLKIDVDVQIDLEVGRTEGNYRPRGRSCRPVTKTSLDYRPPGYKPSWDPKEPCVMCLEEVGLSHTTFRNEETGLLDTWHYECFQAMVDAANWIRVYEAQESFSEEVAV